MRDGLVNAETNGADVPGVPVLICDRGWKIMAENRAEATGMGETIVIAVTARSCCFEMLVCRVVWIAAQASRMAVGGWSVSS